MNAMKNFETISIECCKYLSSHDPSIKLLHVVISENQQKMKTKKFNFDGRYQHRERTGGQTGNKFGAEQNRLTCFLLFTLLSISLNSLSSSGELELLPMLSKRNKNFNFISISFASRTYVLQKKNILIHHFFVSLVKLMKIFKLSSPQKFICKKSKLSMEIHFHLVRMQNN